MYNPPFNLSDWNDGSLNDDQRWKYGLPPSGNANFAWLQHMIHHLSPNGKIGLNDVKSFCAAVTMVWLSGELSQMFKKSHELEKEIRNRLGAIGYEI